MVYCNPKTGLGRRASPKKLCLWSLSRFSKGRPKHNHNHFGAHLAEPHFSIFGCLSGTGESQRDSRESIRANHSQLKPLFLQCIRPIRLNHLNLRFARITRFARIVWIDPLSWVPLDDASKPLSTKLNTEKHKDFASDAPSNADLIGAKKKPWQPQTWQDLTRFSPLVFSLLSPDF